MRDYDHRNPADMTDLVRDLGTATPVQRACAMTFAMAHGVIDSPVPISTTLEISILQFGRARGAGRFASSLSRDPGTLEGLWLSFRDAAARVGEEGMCTAWRDRAHFASFLGFMEKMGWDPGCAATSLPDAGPDEPGARHIP